MFKEDLLQDLHHSFDSHEQNFRLLSNAQEEYLKKCRNLFPEDIRNWVQKDFTELRSFFRTFSTLLHNYLASFYSVTQHIEAISGKICAEGFEKEYQTKKELFMKEEVNSFVRDLRNFAQHRSLPVVGAGVDYYYKQQTLGTNEPPAHAADAILYALPSLRVQDLVKYKKWNAISKRFLKKGFNEIEIMSFVNEAHKNITLFYRWIYAQIKNW